MKRQKKEWVYTARRKENTRKARRKLSLIVKLGKQALRQGER